MKKHLLFAFKIAVACVLVYYLFKSGRLRGEIVLRALHSESIPFLVLSALAFLVSQILSSTRMMFLLRLVGVRIDLIPAFKLTMIGNFFSTVIPGAVGGDIVKGYYLEQNEGTSKGRSAGIVFIDRAVGLIALCTIGFASSIFSIRKYSSALLPYYSELWGIIILSFVIFASFASLLLISKYEPIRNRIRRMILKLFPKGFFYNVVEDFALITRKRRYLCYALLISLAAQGISLAGLLNLLNLNGEGLPDLVALVAASSVVILMGIIPLSPGNIGWTEFLAAVGWSALGAKGGADTFLIWRIITVSCSLIGGFFYLTSARVLNNCEKGSIL